jgi:hypothetical protein
MKQMNNNLVILVALFATCFSVASQAALLNRGGGLIYDDILNVTWLQDANYVVTSGYAANHLKDEVGFDNVFADGRMGGSAAFAWVNQLSFRGYDDWRSPTMRPINGSNNDFLFAVSYDGSTDRDWNITSPRSEMSYMFYVNLMNKGEFDTAGNSTNCGGSCLTNSGLFKNISAFYWMGGTTGANFNTIIGLQNAFENPENELFAWAVRDGDVATIPVPSALWLFASGLFGLFSWKRKQLR